MPPLYVDLKQTTLRYYYRRLYWFKRLTMSQKLIIILLPTVLFIGTIMIYRSYRSIGNLTVVSNTPVRVDFFVMSKCPDAKLCETYFAPSLLKLASIVNFTVSYIGQEPKSNEFQCMHGTDECIGNKQQLCVQSMTSQTNLIKFLQCQSSKIESIPSNGEQCLKEACGDSLKWADVNACVTGSKGNVLMHQALERTRAASASKSCTIHLNGKFWCMHDGSWISCREGHDEMSLIKAICARYSGPNRPVDCAAFV